MQKVELIRSEKVIKSYTDFSSARTGQQGTYADK